MRSWTRPGVRALRVVLAVGFSAMQLSAWAVDKSGVKPNVLALPSGPGSIEGLGESFEPQLNSGTATYAVELAVPPGRNGFAPELTLRYNSGHGNGVFGLGWQLDLPYLQRQTDKGLPFYTDWPDGDGIDNDRDGQTDEIDEFDTMVESSGEELVPTMDGSFRVENEGQFTRYQRSGAGWSAKRRDGSLLRFGMTPASRIQDSSGQIFRWLVDELIDTNGNRIAFNYEKLDSSFQIYGKSIEYNQNGARSMRIEFVHEPRPDVITDFRPRYELRTAFRCKEIRMSESGTPVRSYRLGYAAVSNTQPLSLLTGLTQVGRDGTSSLPPASFQYVSFAGESAEPSAMPSAPHLTLNDTDIDLLDVNADGLPDILDTSVVPHDYFLNLGPDSGGIVKWSGRQSMSRVLDKPLSSAEVQLADMDGDGRTDLLDRFGQDVQYYSVDASLNWQLVGDIVQAGFSFADSNVRLVDLNNDKLIDVLRTGDFDYFAWINRAQGRWSQAFQPPSPNSQIKFDRSYVRLADMNGDRLQDLVRLEDGVCSYYPSLGFGEFGARINVQDPPAGTLAEARLLMADVNGDGMSDALYVGGGQVKVWIYLGIDSGDPSKGRFAPAFSVPAPYTDSVTTFRQADVDGNGSTDILWNTHPGGGAETFAYLDFSAAEQPYQLKRITNGIGRSVTISYRSSILDMIRDRDANQPWPTAVPFPVPVVSRFEVRDGRSATVYATDIRYHDGYYDGQEKEFRGFREAERVEIGDVGQGAPTLVTRYAFDTGATVEALKGKPLQVETRTEEGSVFYRETNTWTSRVLANGLAGDARKVTFPYMSANSRDILESGAGTPVRLEREYQYDDYGNRVLEADYGRVEGGNRSAWDDERFQALTYSAAHPTGRAAWILDRVLEQETRDENGTVIARKRSFYDDETFSGANLGQVSKGNLTMTLDWFDPANSNGFVRAVRSRYDEYGNIIRIYDPLAALDGAGNLADSRAGHFRDLNYDAIFHTFPVQEKIHTGNQDVPGADPTIAMSAAYDPGFGVVTSSSDFNGFATGYGYDTFARLTSIVKPGDTSTYPTVEYQYVLGHDLGAGRLVNWVQTRQREQAGQPGMVDSRSFYDGLGRKVMTRSEGEETGQIVVQDTVQFNARKTAWKRYLPYFETGANGTLEFREPAFNTGFTEQHYDALGREIATYQPIAPGATTRKFARTIYEPLARKVQDEEQTDDVATDGDPTSPHFGCGMRHVQDGLQDKDGEGRLRTVEEIVKINDDGTPSSNLKTWTTSYSYDLLDDLTGYTDSQNNRKFIDYDSLRRKTFMNDPDRGYLWYAYDAGSNLVRTRDAKAQEIAYTYDGVNRLTAEYYLGDAERTGNELAPGQAWTNPGYAPSRFSEVAYHYDLPFGPVELGPNGERGTLELVRDATVGREPLDPVYDLNRDSKVDVADLVTAINRTHSRAQPYADPRSSAVAANVQGYLAWVRDQSGQEHNSYDARGRVEWVLKRIWKSGPADTPVLASFQTRQQYDSMDRVTQMTYPDGAHVDYAYNPRGLLESVPNVITAYDYNPTGQSARLALACGVVTTYEYDHRLRLKRLSTLRTRDNVELQDLNYIFDGASNISAITDERSDADLDKIGAELAISSAEARKFRETEAFLYDSLYRLTEASNPNVFGTINYRYDRIGNMLRKGAALLDPDPLMDLGEMAYGGSVLASGNLGAHNRHGRAPIEPPGPHAFSISAKGGSSRTSLTATYDANGNMSTEREVQLAWDPKDRLIAVNNVTANAAYVYDYSDMRKNRTISSRTDGVDDEILYVNGSSELRTGKILKYIYSGNGRIASSDLTLVDSSSFRTAAFYLNDHLGSTIITLSANGSAAEQMAYYPYGHLRRAKLGTQPSQHANYKFTGKEHDYESGFQYFERRLYAEHLGRFCSLDPKLHEIPNSHVDSPQSLNAYAYTVNNPMVNVDPDGKDLVKYTTPASDYVVGQRTVLLDSKAVTKVNTLLKFAIENQIKVQINSSFRTSGQQGSSSFRQAATTPAKVGTSAHEAGSGIDFNLFGGNGRILKQNKGITSDHPFVKEAKELGFRWGGEFNKKDSIHLDLGLDQRSEDITRNQNQISDLNDPQKIWGTIAITAPDGSKTETFIEGMIIRSDQ